MDREGGLGKDRSDIKPQQCLVFTHHSGEGGLWIIITGILLPVLRKIQKGEKLIDTESKELFRPRHRV